VRQNESFTLESYRQRYAQYKTDPDLQAAHLAAPWIVTWDDHEVANDYAADRDEWASPTFAERRAAAYQAFYEHMPLRLPPPRSFASVRMFQRYDWGRLARFHVLDDRQYRAYEACPGKRPGGSNSVGPRACPSLLDPSRTMLGLEQEAWLERPADVEGALEHPGAADADGAVDPGADRRRGRRPLLDRWLGWLSDGAQAFVRHAGEDPRGNPLVLGGDVHTFYASELRRISTARHRATTR
jgi:alkaline phosphatase D